MVRGEPLTAIIPVRGGSKGVPRKNLHRLDGETLLERSIRFAGACPRIDAVYVTTDDAEMHAIAQAHNVAMPVLRPPELASDSARSVDAVRHLLETVPVQSGYVVLLQVTTPLRRIADLEGLCARFEAVPQARAAVSVVRHEEPHPHKMLSLQEGFVTPMFGSEPNVPRQSLPPVWALNGAFYLTHRDTVLNEGTLMPSATLGHEMPGARSVNIDTPLDLLVLEALIKADPGVLAFGPDLAGPA